MPSAEPERVPLRLIAARAGVSVMTVSRALREHHEVSAPTVARIKSIAAELGYRPDPALAALASYRTALSTVREYRTLAFVTNFARESDWKNDWTYWGYFEGAGRRALELGYNLEKFSLRAARMTPRRASEVLFNRGVKGLLIAPLPDAGGSLDLQWEHFACVALGRSLVTPQLHTVSPNQVQTVPLVWRQLRERGYRRVGLVLTHHEDARTDHSYLAAHLSEQSQHTEHPIPVFRTETWEHASLRKWLRAHAPDVVIAQSTRPCELLRDLGYRVPEDLGFAVLNAPAWKPCAGAEQGHRIVGAAAVDLLHLKLQRNEFGVPPRRELLLVDSIWQEGATLRKPTSVAR